MFLALIGLVVITALVLALPPDPNAEEFENRAMYNFPAVSTSEVISGNFFTGLENFLLDNTAFRTTWLTFSSIAENSYGLNFGGTAQMVDFAGADLGIGLVPLVEEFIPDETVEPTWTFDDLRIGQVNPSLPFSQDVLFNEDAIFYLRYNENQTLAARYAEVLNAHHSRIPQDVRMFSMLAPVKVEFMDERYRAANSSQLDTINFVNSLLHPDIITVDAHTPLWENRDEYIFFRLDHHWTALGAYFAYLEFARTAGFEPITIENYVEYAIHGFVGSLAVGTRNRTILAHPDTVYFYKLLESVGIEFSINLYTIPQYLGNTCYRIFLGGDHAFLHFTSSNQNGRTLMVVKDSFANALVPWLAPHYENIVMVDPRQFVGSIQDVIAQFENIDLLFINYMPATTMADLIEQIYEVR